MERCYLCGNEFDPIKPPIEPPEFFGIKPPHKTMCPSCFLKGLQDVLKFTSEAMPLIISLVEEMREKKKKEKSI